MDSVAWGNGNPEFANRRLIVSPFLRFFVSAFPFVACCKKRYQTNPSESVTVRKNRSGTLQSTARALKLRRLTKRMRKKPIERRRFAAFSCFESAIRTAHKRFLTMGPEVSKTPKMIDRGAHGGDNSCGRRVRRRVMGEGSPAQPRRVPRGPRKSRSGHGGAILAARDYPGGG